MGGGASTAAPRESSTSHLSCWNTISGTAMTDVTLWCWTIDRSGPLDWEVLDPNERRRANLIPDPRRRTAFIRAHAGLRAVLGRLLGLLPYKLVFGVGKHGKPHLAMDHGPRFSLSHSNGYAAVAVSWQSDPGLDIEYVRAVDETTLANHYFSPGERRALAAARAMHRRWTFFRIWTLKEAYLKAIGTGLTLPMADFTVSVPSRKAPHLVSMKRGSAAASPWCFANIKTARGYAGALAAQVPELNIHYGNAADAQI